MPACFQRDSHYRTDDWDCERCRAICETRALTAGRELLVNPGRFLTIKAVTVFVDEARGKDGKQPYFSLKKD